MNEVIALKKYIMLFVAMLLCAVLCAAAGQENACTIIPGESGNALIFRGEAGVLLVGNAAAEDIQASLPEAQIDHVVVCCSHEAHVSRAEALALQLNAGVLAVGQEHPMLQWQDGVAHVGSLAFTDGAWADAEACYDCQGNRLQAPARTVQSSVNVRGTASTGGTRVGKLSKGDDFYVTGCVTNSKGEVWYLVILEDGTEGYIRSDLLEITGDAEAVLLVTAVEEASPTEAPAKETRYIGNKNTKVFHRPGCSNLPASKNQVYFSSRSYAIAKGYRPCQNCDP